MEAIEELSQLSEPIMQAAALLADEDVDEIRVQVQDGTQLFLMLLHLAM